MANRPMLSVIIPVYNVEIRFLKECFESILSQTFRDFEMIVVDDGADDELKKYIDGYDWRDVKVLVIHQENRGVAAARNAGLDKA
jgi:glycosyltransferase involved in cell wall biosynthesis